MSVPNQKIVKVDARRSYDGENLFCRTHLDALQTAMINLKGETLKLWLYLNKNQDNYQLELSQKACEEWGIKKDAYYAGVNKLIAIGYLTPVSEGSNIYCFSEKPKTLSEKPKTFSEKPKKSSEKPERNTINTTDTTINTTNTPSVVGLAAQTSGTEEEKLMEITEAKAKEYWGDSFIIADGILSFKKGDCNYGKKFRVAG